MAGPTGDIRAEWLATLEQHRGASWGRPDGDRYWWSGSTRLHRTSSGPSRARSCGRPCATPTPAFRSTGESSTRSASPRATSGPPTTSPKLPVTTKQDMADDIAAHPPWGTYTAVDDDIWRESRLAGVRELGHDRRAAGLPLHGVRPLGVGMGRRASRCAPWASAPERDVALLAFGYGPHVWLWGVHYALNLMGIPIVTGGGLDSRMRARFVDQYRPTILACTPSVRALPGRSCRSSASIPRRPRSASSSAAGEPGFAVPATRRRLPSRTWDAELHEFYGCTEAAPAAGGYTCAAVAADKGGTASTHLMEDLQASGRRSTR